MHWTRLPGSFQLSLGVGLSICPAMPASYARVCASFPPRLQLPAQGSGSEPERDTLGGAGAGIGEDGVAYRILGRLLGLALFAAAEEWSRARTFREVKRPVRSPETVSLASCAFRHSGRRLRR